MTTTQTPQIGQKFGPTIEGSEGILVFGSVPAQHVTIESVGDDHLIAVTVDGNETLAVPLASIVYYRFSA